MSALRALLDLAGPALHAQVADRGAGDAGDDAAEAAEVAPDLGELDAVDGLGERKELLCQQKRERETKTPLLYNSYEVHHDIPNVRV